MTEDDINKAVAKVSPLLSVDYEIEDYDLGWIVKPSIEYTEDTVEYIGYTITNKFKAKSKEKKVTVYIIDVEFVNKEEVIKPKSLYIELVNENSQWKINRIMPCSA